MTTILIIWSLIALAFTFIWSISHQRRRKISQMQRNLYNLEVIHSDEATQSLPIGDTSSANSNAKPIHE